MSKDLSARIKALKAELRETKKKEEAARREWWEAENRGKELKIELHTTSIEWLKTQPLEEHWKYWVRTADDFSVRIYYDGEFVEILDWSMVEREDRENYEEHSVRAMITEVPEENIIRAVVTMCEKSDLLWGENPKPSDFVFL